MEGSNMLLDSLELSHLVGSYLFGASHPLPSTNFKNKRDFPWAPHHQLYLNTEYCSQDHHTSRGLESTSRKIEHTSHVQENHDTLQSIGTSCQSWVGLQNIWNQQSQQGTFSHQNFTILMLFCSWLTIDILPASNFRRDRLIFRDSKEMMLTKVVHRTWPPTISFWLLLSTCWSISEPDDPFLQKLITKSATDIFCWCSVCSPL